MQVKALSFAAVAILAGIAVCGEPKVEKLRARIDEIARLDSGELSEVSGLALSSDGRMLYAMNDSGDRGRVFVLSLTGQLIRTVEVPGWSPFDIEALSLGPCPVLSEQKNPVGFSGQNSQPICLVAADVGNNKLKRKNPELVFFRESDLKKESMHPLKRLVVRYPDGPAVNSEAVFVFDAKNSVLIEKGTQGTAPGSRVFAIDHSTGRARRIGVWPIHRWTAVNDGASSALATDVVLRKLSDGIATSKSEYQLALLTYQQVLLLKFEIESIEDFNLPQIVRVLEFEALAQQEALALASHKAGRLPAHEIEFFMTSELPLSNFGLPAARFRAPLVKVSSARKQSGLETQGKFNHD